MEEVCNGVRQGFRSGRTQQFEWRIQQLNSMIRMVEEGEGEIMQALFLDVGKSAHQAYTSELSSVKQACKLAIKNLKSWMAPLKVSTPAITFPSRGEIVPEPLGAVLVISAWNFPFLLSLDPVVGAIAAGNAVVLKPSEVAPATSALLAKLVASYMDRSAIRVVEGGVPQTTALLEQQWDKIFYTGSTRVGKIVLAAAAKNLTPVVLELGGKCPLLIDSTADLKVTARRIILGKWATNNGQTCISPDYILAEESTVAGLVSALRECLVDCFGTDPSASKDLSRVVNNFHFKRLLGLLDEVEDKVVHGGERDETQLYIAPTLVLDPPTSSAIMNEEVFGPLLSIITVSSMDAAIEFVNSRPKPLALYVFTMDKLVEQRVVKGTSAGGMLVNDTVFHAAVATLPFGGVGQSGMGSYHGKFSFDAFSHRKSVLYRSFRGESEVKYPPYTAKKQRITRCLLDGDYIGLLRAILF